MIYLTLWYPKYILVLILIFISSLVALVRRGIWTYGLPDFYAWYGGEIRVIKVHQNYYTKSQFCWIYEQLMNDIMQYKYWLKDAQCNSDYSELKYRNARTNVKQPKFPIQPERQDCEASFAAMVINAHSYATHHRFTLTLRNVGLLWIFIS